MSQITETICDRCGARKQKSNYWWQVYLESDGLHLYTKSPNVTPSPEIKDLCSMKCVTLEVNEFMNNIVNTPTLAEEKAYEKVYDALKDL